MSKVSRHIERLALALEAHFAEADRIEGWGGVPATGMSW
jgi:hypothetical protein